MTVFISTWGLSLNLWRKTYVSLNTSLVDDLVNVVCCDSWNCRCSSNIQHLSRQLTYFAHPRNLGLVQNLDSLSSSNLLGSWDSIARIIWLWDMRWDFPGLGEWIDWAQWSSKFVGRKWVEGACDGVWFRYYVRGEEVTERVT